MDKHIKNFCAKHETFSIWFGIFVFIVAVFAGLNFVSYFETML